MRFGLAEGRDALDRWFAPWVKELELELELCEGGRVRARQPHSAHLDRAVGGLSGQAIMAAIDTLMVLAVQTTLDEPRMITTINQSTNFLRAINDSDVVYEVDIVKPGRTITFGEARAYVPGAPERICATAAITYAILEPMGAPQS